MSNQRLAVFFFSFLGRRRRRRNSCQKAVMKKKNVGWEKKAWNSVAYTRSGPAQSYLLILPWYLVLVNLYEGELYFRPFFLLVYSDYKPRLPSNDCSQPITVHWQLKICRAKKLEIDTFFFFIFFIKDRSWECAKKTDDDGLMATFRHTSGFLKGANHKWPRSFPWEFFKS